MPCDERRWWEAAGDSTTASSRNVTVQQPCAYVHMIWRIIGGYNPYEKYVSFQIDPNSRENNKCLKSPASVPIMTEWSQPIPIHLTAIVLVHILLDLLVEHDFHEHPLLLNHFCSTTTCTRFVYWPWIQPRVGDHLPSPKPNNPSASQSSWPFNSPLPPLGHNVSRPHRPPKPTVHWAQSSLPDPMNSAASHTHKQVKFWYPELHHWSTSESLGKPCLLQVLWTKICTRQSMVLGGGVNRGFVHSSRAWSKRNRRDQRLLLCCTCLLISEAREIIIYF